MLDYIKRNYMVRGSIIRAGYYVWEFIENEDGAKLVVRIGLFHGGRFDFEKHRCK